MRAFSRRLASLLRASCVVGVLAALPAAAASKKPAAAQKSPTARPQPAAKPPAAAPLDDLKVPVSPVPAPRVDTPPAPAATSKALVLDDPPRHVLGLFLGAEAGVLAPLSVLTVGVRAGARAEYRIVDRLPLLAAVAVGFERHTATTARQFSPPAGGYDPAAAESQTVLAIELGALIEVWSNEHNAIIAGLSYSLLPSWSRAAALGSVTSEFGVGQQVAIDAGYTRHFGSFDLFLRGRWAVRHTASGLRTSTIEQPWYQALGLLAGAGFTL